MYKISDDQIDFILSDIEANGIDLEDLKEGLLDHICCIIESEYKESVDFYLFYDDVKRRFFKDSFDEIQKETIDLLTFKNFFAMKKTLKITGLLSVSLTILGAIFKTYHWPGAGACYVIGAALFSLIFLPLLIILKFRDDESKKEKIVFSFGLLLGSAACLGVLFKLMSWPGANMMFRGSVTLFIFLYVPLYYVIGIRKPEKKFNVLVNTVLMMACGCMLYGLIKLH
jgi:hypothetical protein